MSTADYTGSERNKLAATVFETSKDTPITALLMHGGGQTRHSWHQTANALAQSGIRAVTIDARGHGDSDHVESLHYRFEDFSEDLLAIAQQTRARFGGRVVSVGASMGGLSTMLAMGRQPDTFDACVFVDIVPQMERSGVERIMGFMAEHMGEGFASVEEAADAIARYLPERKRPKSNAGLAKNLRTGSDGRFRWHWDPAFAAGPFSILHGRSEDYADFKEACTAIAVPTLLVRGAQSDLVTLDAVAEFRRLVPQSEFVDISEAGHMIVGDRNDAFTDAVTEFLGRLPLDA